MMNQESAEKQQLNSLIGHRLGPYMSFNAVSATQIWQWCSAMGDNNPSYHPGDNQIAPPAMMQMWTMRDINDSYAPGSTDAPPYQVFDDMAAMGYQANVAVSYDIRFLRYLRVGERARHYTTIVNISDKKTTALGTGYFVTEQVEYTTLDNRPFAEAHITYYQYQQEQGQNKQDHKPRDNHRTNIKAPTEDGEPDRNDRPLAAGNQWSSDFRDIDINSLHVGHRLPELTIPITHKLIVGGAIATQDFIPVHHNVPAAKAAGMPDIFMNILTTCGLCGRYLSDWAGAGSRLKAIKINLMAPNLPGDTMVMEGELAEINSTAGGTEAIVDFAGRNGLGFHTRGSATLALPGP